jgi:glycine cleavage system regulatory protein
MPRGVTLELIGDDRPGIVASLTRILSERGISIDHLHTELVGGVGHAPRRFKVDAHLRVPPGVSGATLRHELDALAAEMRLDVALGDES